MPTKNRWIGDTKLAHSKPVPADDWLRYKEVIVCSYASMTLKEVRQKMEDEYQFFAT